MKETIQIPDGKGGTKTVQAKRHQGKVFEDVPDKMLEARETEAWERIGAAAENFNKYHKAYATDHNLSEEELVAACYLENLNLSEYYPRELGGTQKYHEICKTVWEWFEENKSKK